MDGEDRIGTEQHRSQGWTINRRSLLTGIGGVALAGCQQTQDQAPADRDGPTQDDCVPRSEYEELRSDCEDLQSQYEDLREEYNDLQDQLEYAVNPPYIVAEGREYSIAYNSIEGTPARYTIGADTFESQINVGTYMRELSIDQMEYLGFDDLPNRFEGNSKYTQLGDYGRYYQLEPFVISSNFETVSDDFYSMFSTDMERIREAWNFVTQLNVYSEELQETPRLPLETLLMGGGDCEDTTVLLASILAAMPADWTVEIVYMDIDNPTDPQTINHTVIWVETDSVSTFLETTSNQEMRPYERVNGFFQGVE